MGLEDQMRGLADLVARQLTILSAEIALSEAHYRDTNNKTGLRFCKTTRNKIKVWEADLRRMGYPTHTPADTTQETTGQK